MIEEQIPLDQESGEVLPAADDEPALEFPAIGRRELLLFKIEQIFIGSEGDAVDIRRRTLRTLTPESFIRSVRAAIEVAVADGLIPESSELSEYLASLAVPETKNGENKYPGRREREKKMEQLVNGVVRTLQTEHGVNMVDILEHSVQELQSLLEKLYGSSVHQILEDLDAEPESDRELDPENNPDKLITSRTNELGSLKSVLILFVLLGLISSTLIACGGGPNDPAQATPIYETMPPTPTSSEKIEMMSQHSGKLYYLRPGEGLDAVIWEVVNTHNPDAHPVNSDSENKKISYDQAKELLRLMNIDHNPFIVQANGTDNFSNSGALATVIVPSWLLDPGYYGVNEPRTREESYQIQPNDTLEAIAARLSIVDRNAWYQEIKINGRAVTDINAIPAGGIITWTVKVPASYKP